MISILIFSQTKAAGIELFSIGIGDDINDVELRSIASNPGFYYFVKNYNQLSTIRNALANKLCQGLNLSSTSNVHIYTSR